MNRAGRSRRWPLRLLSMSRLGSSGRRKFAEAGQFAMNVRRDASKSGTCSGICLLTSRLMGYQ